MSISTLLIDLSSIDQVISKDTLRELLVERVDNKKWIYNKRERVIYRRFRAKARPFENAEKGDGTFCPQYLYGYKGVSSARWVDCVHCEYCFSISGEVNCLGYSGVSKIADLNNPCLAEVAIKLKKENRIKPEWLEGTQCKICRQGYLVIRNGKNGNFLGCNKYPNCRNTIKI